VAKDDLPASPVRLYAAFRLQAQGHGCRRIATLLEDQGVFTTKSSVNRLLRGLPPYWIND